MPTNEAKKEPAEHGELLKAAARSAYTLAREHVPLRTLLERPEFAGLGYRQLYAWYSEEDWAQERRMNLSAWARSAKAQQGESDRMRQQHMASLRHLYQEAERLRSHHTVRPKSWEALAQFQLRAVELFRQWEQEDHDRRAEQGQRGSGQPFAGSEYSGRGLSAQEEWMAAQAMLKGRMEDDEPAGPQHTPQADVPDDVPQDVPQQRQSVVRVG